MSTLLISLISDQTTPNLLLIKEFPQVDRHLFVTTPEMERKNQSEHLRQATGLAAEQIEKIQVEADSLDDVQQKLEKVKFADDDHFLVNLTGGTKLMSIGVYNFFRNLSSEMFYIDIRKHTFRKVFPVVKRKENPLKYELSLKEYLTGYGLVITNEADINALIRDSAYTTAFYKKFLSFSEFDHSLISALRANRKKRIPLDETESTMLKKRWGFALEADGYIDKHEIRYLTGEWFEEYVYNWMKTFLKLDDRQIGAGVSIKRQDVENEFDVLFYHNHTLSVIECKTALWDSSTNRNFLNDTLYKLDALRSDFGLRVKAYLFTLAERGPANYNIRDHHEERAKLIGVEIVDRAVLTSAEKRAELMKKIR